MIRYHDERIDQVEALKVRYLRNEISEAVFSASLHGVGGMTAEDIRHTMIEYAPAPRSPTFEERRLEISRAWMLSYLKGRR